MPARRLPGVGSVAIVVAVAALVAWSAWQRWAMLTESPFPVGIDGYFYPIQLRALLEDGTLAYPASPLAFWLMAPLAAATDPITGAKLGAALLGALAAAPAYAIGARLTGSRGAGLLVATLLATSAGSAFLTFEFVKNGIGVTVALTALWLVLRALEMRTRLRIACAIAGVIAAVLTHKMAAVVVIAVAVPATFAELRAQGRLRGRHGRTALAVIAGLAVVAVGIGIAFPARFVSPDDLQLLARAFTSDARWDAPALVLPRHTLTMGYEAAIGGALAVVAAFVLSGAARRLVARVPGAAAWLTEDDPWRGTAATRAASWVIIGLALVIALPWLAVTDPQGVGFRIRIFAFVPMALCAAIVARAIYVPIGRVIARLVAAPQRRTWARELALAAIAAIVLVAAPRARTDGRIVTHPAMVAAVQALRSRIPDGGVAIVPERHIAFMVTWYARVPMRLRPDAIVPARRWRVMPLAFIGAGSPLDAALDAARREPSIVPPLGLHPRHPNGLVLVVEPTWAWVLDQLPPRTRAYFEAWPTI